jgi:hypothetical protein
MKIVKNSGFSSISLNKRFSHILSSFSNFSSKNTPKHMYEKFRYVFVNKLTFIIICTLLKLIIATRFEIVTISLNTNKIITKF